MNMPKSFKLVLLLLAVVFSGTSHAVINKFTQWSVSDQSYFDKIGWHNSKPAACAAAAAYATSSNTLGVTYGSNDTGENCYLTRGSNMQNTKFWYRKGGDFCPINSHSAGSTATTCECDVGFVESEGQCVVKPPPKCEKDQERGFSFKAGDKIPSSLCTNECRFDFDGSTPIGWSSNPVTGRTGTASYVSNGQTCTGNGPDIEPPKPPETNPGDGEGGDGGGGGGNGGGGDGECTKDCGEGGSGIGDGAAYAEVPEFYERKYPEGIAGVW